MKDTRNTVLFITVLFVAFGLVFAVIMPEATEAWDSWHYWGGILGMSALASLLVIGIQWLKRSRL